MPKGSYLPQGSSRYDLSLHALYMMPLHAFQLCCNLCKGLGCHFFQVRKKDQINVESKIKVVRFIGEVLI